MRIKVKTGSWSASSQRSWGPPSGEVYKDETYPCSLCGNTGVFSAETQRHAFEVKKQSIWTRRSLCSSCWAKYLTLLKADNESQREWATRQHVLKHDRQFLERWLEALESRPRYNRSLNHARIAMIKKHLLALP